MNLEQLDIAKGINVNRVQMLAILQSAVDRGENRFALEASRFAAY